LGVQPRFFQPSGRSQRSLAKQQAALTELDVAAAAADAFLTVLAADEGVRATRANVDRLEIFGGSVRTLVQNQLRPGADQSRSDAELAVARNQLSRAVQIAEVARASLAEAIGAAGASLELSPGPLASIPELTATPLDTKSHPAALAGQAAVDVVRARERSLDRAFSPDTRKLSPRDHMLNSTVKQLASDLAANCFAYGKRPIEIRAW